MKRVGAFATDFERSMPRSRANDIAVNADVDAFGLRAAGKVSQQILGNVASDLVDLVGALYVGSRVLCCLVCHFARLIIENSHGQTLSFYPATQACKREYCIRIECLQGRVRKGHPRLLVETIAW